MTFVKPRSFIAVLLLLSVTVEVCQGSSYSGVTITATVISKGNCKFTTAPSPLEFLGANSLNPMDPVDRTIPSNTIFQCTGKNTVYTITDNGGNNQAGDVPRLQHTIDSSLYIPYTLSYSPKSGTAEKNKDVPLDIFATILGLSYQDKPAGIYTDEVELTITP